MGCRILKEWFLRENWKVRKHQLISGISVCQLSLTFSGLLQALNEDLRSVLNSFLCGVKSQGSSFYSACDYVIFPVLLVEEERVRQPWLSGSRSSTRFHWSWDVWLSKGVSRSSMRFHRSWGVFCARVMLTRHRGSVVYCNTGFSNSPLLLRMASTVWGLWWFHMNFRMNFSIPVKTIIRDLMVIALNLNAALTNVAVFTVLTGSVSSGAWEVF